MLTTRTRIAVFALAASTVAAPASADQRMVIFLHNAWYEGHKGGEPHPKFGVYDLDGITEALASGLSSGGSLAAPERGPQADPAGAAEALAEQLAAAIAAGRDPETITVIGASKGAHIAQLASERLGEPALSWVLVGGCHTARMAAGDPPAMTGRVLSIVERSDTVAGPCAAHPALYADAAAFEEIETETGLDHGFQFTAHPAWLTPALAW